MGLLDNFTSWAQSPQSQPAADGLLAAGLGILARNRGLNSGLAAVGQGGLDGLQQYQQSKQLQMQQQLQNAQLQQLGFGLQKNKMLLNLAQQYLGGDPSGTSPQAAAHPTQMAAPTMDAGGLPAGPQGSGPGVQSAPVLQPGGAPVGAVPSSPLAGAAPMQQPQAALSAPPAATAQSATSVPGSPFGNMPRGLVAYGLMTDPAKLFENAAAQYSPTDLQKTMRAAGIDPNSTLGKQILQQNIAKTNYIAPVALRPGGAYLGSDGQLRSTPAAAPAGFENVPLSDGTWRTVPVQGGTDAITASTAAGSRGKAGYELQDVWDPTANSGKGGMIKQTVSNVADAAGGAPATAPAPMRNNNPGAMMPGGKLAQYPNQQAGLQAMDDNLAGYGKQGVNTIAGVVSKWAPPNENDTQAYIADVSQRLGIPANQKIDLSQPVVRHALSAAIALHENGPQGVFGYGGASAPGAVQTAGGTQRPEAFASAPPLGQTSNANASQAAPADTMKSAYETLQSGSAAAPSALEAIDKMIALAKQKSPAMAGPIGTSSIATALSPNAAEYEKQRANVIGLIAKQGGLNGTDAGRALVGESVPDYGKPQSAMLDGLQTQRNQIVANQLKTNLLTPAYNSGDSQTFTRLSNEFDQHIKPSMAPILQMPSSDIKRTAVQAAIKANPSLRPNFEWAFNNGLLK